MRDLLKIFHWTYKELKLARILDKLFRVVTFIEPIRNWNVCMKLWFHLRAIPFIEPIRNWNCWAFCRWHRGRYPFIEPIRNWNRGWVISNIACKWAFIEPIRNWNKPYPTLIRIFLDFHWTYKELKPFWDSDASLHASPFIEPIRNWNHHTTRHLQWIPHLSLNL